MRRKYRLTIAACAIVLACASSAQALPIGLALVLDESGSISAGNWTLQRDAYANVLGSALIPTNGSLVIGVWKFDDSVEQVFAPTLIDSAAAKANLLLAITSMTQEGGLTAIGDAVTAARNGLVGYGLANLAKAVIDVSTDGANNFGSNPTTASNAALAAGIAQVNCLAIGAGGNCTWNPASSLDFVANDFGDFESALEDKIRTETRPVPEPASAVLYGLGAAAIALARRRSRRA